MATAYRAPEGFDFKLKDWGNYNDEVDAYINKLKKWCKQNSPSKDHIVGEIVKTPIADGYAMYMVFNTKPFQLIHVAAGDAWNADRCWIRGLRLSDAKKMIESDKAIARLFGGE